MTTRPGYHITPPLHWLNDPNGPLFWEGRWHMFFQHNPAAPRWGPPHWGHVSSDDLVHWQRHPVALSPTPGTADADGCWSGCARIVDGVPTIYYTGVVGRGDDDRVEAVMRATSGGTLDHWDKDPDPVIAAPPAGADHGFHRDPYLYEEDGAVHLLLGTSIDGTGGAMHGAVRHYRREAGGPWVHDGLFFDGRGDWGIETGPLWECPQLLRFDDLDVLIVSVQAPEREHPLSHVVAFCGQVDGGRFTAESAQRLDGGDLFYAPAAMHHDGRWLLWGWIQDHDPDEGPGNPQRRVGALSLPLEVTAVEGRVRVAPVGELAALRRSTSRLADVEVPPGERHTLPVGHAQMEITFTAEGRGCLDLLTRGWTGAETRIPLRTRIDQAVGVRLYVDADIIEVSTTTGVHHTTRRSSTQPGLELSASHAAIDVRDTAVHVLAADAVRS